MLEVNFLRQNKEEAIQLLKLRKAHGFILEIQQVLSLDELRKKMQTQLSDLQRDSKKTAEEVGLLLKTGKKDQAEVQKIEAQKIRQNIDLVQKELGQIEADLLNELCKIPNIPQTIVPVGQTDADNLEVFRHEKEVNLPSDAQPHWDLVKHYDLVDFELGNKITGAGFPVYRKQGAKLQRSLINFFLDRAIAAGYEEILPPYLVNAASAFATAQLPDKEGQMYHVTADDLYLIPTAEVPVTNILRDVLLKESQLPIKYTAYSPCFRREAGSWGAHVRGLNRLHQFEKVEIVQATLPEQSAKTQEEMLEHIKSLLTDLELPFRILRLCGGDLTFGSSLTYDFEVYSAAQKRWLEVSSVSNFLTFQSNRLKLRYKDAEGKINLAHTLNGSALALPRMMAAILENNQSAKGIMIPKVLQKYTDFDCIV